MAAVTVDRRRSIVMGSKRVIVAQIDVAADADTWDTKLKLIESAHASSETNAAIGFTKSGGTLTFQTGGAENNVLVTVIGV